MHLLSSTPTLMPQVAWTLLYEIGDVQTHLQKRHLVS
jgi:hypothetical protein